MEEISLFELWAGIKKRLAWIILATIVLGVTAFGVSKFLIQPKYQAQATMLIGKPADYNTQNQGIKYNDILLNQKLVSTYSEIIKSRGIAQQVIDNLDLGFNLSEFQEKVTVKTVKDTEVISVIVTDTIPARARDIANETAEIFQHDIKDIMHVDNVNLLDEALLPEDPVSPKILRNTALGALLGLFAASFLAVFIEINDTRIKTSEQLQEKFNLPVLGIIPEIKEKK